MSSKHSDIGSMGNIKGEVKRAGHKAAFNPLMESLTRLGFGVRGFIYITIGMLALSVAFGKGGTLVDPQGAIAAIGKQPAGLFLLWVVLIGLISYALWGVIRAVFDPLGKGNDSKGVLARVGFLLSAASYAYLALYTYGLISGSGSSAQGGGGPQHSLATIMSAPWGRWLIGLIGLGILIDGLYQIILGLDAKFDKQYKTYAMTPEEVHAATQLGRIGTAARGIVFAMVGGLILVAAVQSNPNQPVGIGAALSTLLRQPYGIWLLGLIALGLIAFGLYSMLSAVWFRSRR
jgi:Domain of Unknown Function (DUF1206)